VRDQSPCTDCYDRPIVSHYYASAQQLTLSVLASQRCLQFTCSSMKQHTTCVAPVVCLLLLAECGGEIRPHCPVLLFCRNCCYCSTAVLTAVAASVPPVAAGAFQISELPRDPATACASQQVRSALFTCGLSGPSAQCCSGLDAVFAVRGSPSAG
jgi:hypothetical protein